MQYVWVFSLLFFTQLSWSVDENTQAIHDSIDIIAETLCKDHENPETCKAEYKAEIEVLLHQLGKTFGLKHKFADSSNTNSVMTYDEGQSGEAPPSGHWMDSVIFVTIDAGSFIMGSPSNEKDRDSDEDQVSVEITKSFEIMEKELTQKQWYLVKKENPSHFKKPEHCDDHEVIDGVKMCPNHPVEKVSWDDIQDYIKELNASLGLSGCNGTPQDASGCYRLPTEAEWEYAARGGTSMAYSFVENLGDYAWYRIIFAWRKGNLSDYAWYRRNSGGRTHKVGTRKANPEGLYDVHGNVWEWVQDKYSRTLSGGTDPLNTSGFINRVLRGGGWFYHGAWSLRSANRSYSYPGEGYDDVGFRLVRTL